ncbi:hypothetical protein B0H11DRAFT_1923948 [Mycena galericulata]|nr:hypothetical protein B0H11DRAFT_1923948 [Mycena galericulata]
METKPLRFNVETLIYDLSSNRRREESNAMSKSSWKLLMLVYWNVNLTPNLVPSSPGAPDYNIGTCKRGDPRKAPHETESDNPLSILGSGISGTSSGRPSNPIANPLRSSSATCSTDTIKPAQHRGPAMNYIARKSPMPRSTDHESDGRTEPVRRDGMSNHLDGRSAVLPTTMAVKVCDPATHFVTESISRYFLFLKHTRKTRDRDGGAAARRQHRDLAAPHRGAHTLAGPLAPQCVLLAIRVGAGLVWRTSAREGGGCHWVGCSGGRVVPGGAQKDECSDSTSGCNGSGCVRTPRCGGAKSWCCRRAAAPPSRSRV